MHSFFGDNIKKLRTAKKMSQEQLADIFGITKAGISYWETGRSEPNFATVQKLADFFGVTTSDLLGEADDEIFINAALEYERVTLYSALCCGNGGFTDDEILDFIAVPSEGLSKSAEYFAQYAKGDSMKDAGIDDGDLLIFEKNVTPYSGMIGCFCIDENEAMCKKYIETAGIITLQPMNSHYDPIVINPSINHFVCVGKLKKAIKNF